MYSRLKIGSMHIDLWPVGLDCRKKKKRLFPEQPAIYIVLKPSKPLSVGHPPPLPPIYCIEVGGCLFKAYDFASMSPFN